MGQFWARLLACERRTQRFLYIIQQQQRLITTLQQQLADLQGTL